MSYQNRAGMRAGAKGQVFSIDAMLSLLPMMMIVGAALQYTYLAGEQAQILAQDSSLESKMQLFSGNVMAQYVASGGPLDCGKLGTYANNAGSLLKGDSPLAKDYLYDVRVGKDQCVIPPGEQAVWRLDNLQNPAASGSRMMLFSEGGSEPEIAEVHFTVWKDI